MSLSRCCYSIAFTARPLHRLFFSPSPFHRLTAPPPHRFTSSPLHRSCFTAPPTYRQGGKEILQGDEPFPLRQAAARQEPSAKRVQTGDFTASAAFYFNRIKFCSAGNDEIDFPVAMSPVCYRIINRMKVVDKMRPTAFSTRRPHQLVSAIDSLNERFDRALTRALFQSSSLGLLPRLRTAPREKSPIR